MTDNDMHFLKIIPSILNVKSVIKKLSFQRFFMQKLKRDLVACCAVLAEDEND